VAYVTVYKTVKNGFKSLFGFTEGFLMKIYEYVEYTPKQQKNIKKFWYFGVGIDPWLFTTFDGLKKQIKGLDSEGFIYYLQFREYEDKPNKWYDLIGFMYPESFSIEKIFIRKNEVLIDG
jgi:hypothetical protein